MGTCPKKTACVQILLSESASGESDPKEEKEKIKSRQPGVLVLPEALRGLRGRPGRLFFLPSFLPGGLVPREALEPHQEGGKPCGQARLLGGLRRKNTREEKATRDLGQLSGQGPSEERGVQEDSQMFLPFHKSGFR